MSETVELTNDSPTQMRDGVFAVANNLVNYTQDQRERILMAVAVLYGIVPVMERERRL